jgi:hypothetical protein
MKNLQFQFYKKVGIVPVLLLKWKKKKRFWFQLWVQLIPLKNFNSSFEKQIWFQLIQTGTGG